MRARRTRDFSEIDVLTKPANTSNISCNFQLEKYNNRVKKAGNHYFEYQENNHQVFKIMNSCSPLIMTSKLKTMAGWITIQKKQDGIGVMKIVPSAIFEYDGLEKSIVEYMITMKKLFLVYYKKDKLIVEYVCNFKATLNSM